MIVRIPLIIATVVFLGVLGSPTRAQIPDPRIVETSYLPETVYSISISSGLATVVEFANDESVDSVVVGDAANWLIETTGSGNRVVVKPGDGADSTNMIVVTTKRTYTFTLNAYGGQDVFVLRFTYGDKQTAPQSTYRYRGDKRLFPRLMSDNGRTTSIFWPKGVQFPAVLLVDEGGDEIAAASRAAGEGLIIEGVHENYIFRIGKNKATAQRRVERHSKP